MATCMDSVHPAISCQRKLKARMKELMPGLSDENLDGVFPDDVEVSFIVSLLYTTVSCLLFCLILSDCACC